MKKTVLLLLVLALTGSAQRVMAQNSGQLWWGYFTDSDAKSLSFDGYLGYSQATTFDAAIRIPAGHPIAGNGTIKSVRFWLGDDISSINSNLTLWISSSLPSDISSAAYKQTVPKSSLKGRLNEIELTTPYNINNKTCYIGYSFSIKSSSYPIMGGGEDEENAWFFRVTGTDWMDFCGDGYGYGKLAMQVLLEGITISGNSVTPSDFGTNYVLMGSKLNVPVKISNYGSEVINSIAYTITTNGSVSEEQTCKVNSLTFNNSETVNIPFSADNDTRKYAKTLTITKVNGVANEAERKSSEGSLITISEKPVSTPVVEEFTGTWCGWCTIGYDGMEKAKATFGDKAVLIAVHSGDVMEISDYAPIASRASSYPSSIINRSIDTYPSEGNLKYYINQCLNDITVGEINAKATWANIGKKSIKIDTETKFVYTDDNGQYGIAYVLIEDGLTGTGSGWAQSNYLSGNGSYAADYPFWYSAGSKVAGLEFNHVAVAAWSIANGVDGSVKSAIQAGEIQTFSKTVDITSKSLIQDISRLKVVALLIDRTTGNIVNASETAIREFGPDAIDEISASAAQELERYTLDGRKIAAPQTGVNLVKMSDGTVRKVFVK